MREIKVSNNIATSLCGEQRKFKLDNVYYKIDSVSGMGFVEYLSRLVVNYSNISYIIPDYDLKILFL